MTSPDQDQISLDDLFAAVGVSVPEPEPAPEPVEAPVEKPRAPRSTAPDTTEQDLLNALGISRAASFEKKAAEEPTVDAEPLDERERVEAQKARASQWRQELQEAGKRTVSAPVPAAASVQAVEPEAPSEEAVTQPLQATVAALPTLTGDVIRPFGADAVPGRIGVLEGSASPQQTAGPQGQGLAGTAVQSGAMQQPGQQPWQPQGASQADHPQPLPGQAQPGQFQQSGLQPFSQQPQAAFQQAQQMPLQPLQPIDRQVPQTDASGQPMPLPTQPLQTMGEGAQLQPVEQQVAQEALQSAQMQEPSQPEPQDAVTASSQQAGQVPAQQPMQPVQPQQPMQPQPQPQQPFPMNAGASLWQQQMAQQVNAASAPQAQSEPMPDQPGSQPSQPLPIQSAEGESTDRSQPMQPVPLESVEAAAETTQEQPLPFASQPQLQSEDEPAEPAPRLGIMQPPAVGEGGAPQSPFVPQQGFSVMQPPVPPLQQQGVEEPLKDLDKEAKSSKAAHIVGGILIFIALICVVFAICLLTGVVDLSAVNPNRSVQSSSSSGQLSGQAAPSATSTEGASEGSAALTDPSNNKAGQVVYSYVVRGVDGGTHEAVETATFGDDGKLVSSTLEIQTDSQMDSDQLLDQLQQEFGDSLVESSATEDKVVCTVKLPRDDLDRESYTELLSTNAPEFKVVSS